MNENERNQTIPLLNRSMSETESLLVEDAIGIDGGEDNPDRVAELVHRLDHPEWDKPGRTHNWRDSVPEFVTEIWPILSLETKLLMYILAVAETEKGYGERDDIAPDEL